MSRITCAAVLITLAVVSAQNTDQSSPASPCPQIFTYEQRGKEEGKWYGVINLTTDIVLHGLWLNIVLDSKADILGNWVGEVTTKDNIDFNVKNTAMKINPGPPLPVRFFVQYNRMNKPPILTSIRLNGKEICSLGIALAVPDTPSKLNSTDSRINIPWSLEKSKPSVRAQAKGRTENISRTSGAVTNTEKGTISPVAADSFIAQRNNDNDRDDFMYKRPHSVNTGSPSANQYTTSSNDDIVLTASTTSRTSGVDGGDYVDDDEDYVGGIPTIYIPGNLERTTKKVQCGKVIFNSSSSDVVENGVMSLEGQFPWQIALYQNQRSGENKYICGGTLVTHRHVITAAHCVTRRGQRRIVNRNTLTMYLGKHNLRTSVDGVQIKFVGKITIHPEYNATTFSRDIAVLQLKESVTYTDHVLPICLWPEGILDLSSVIGKHGSVVGWGFEDSGATKQELSLVKMPVIDSETCIKSYNAYFASILSEYSYCATFAEGTSVCNGDSGGGMVFKSGDTWYLRGVASLSVAKQDQYRCDPDHFVIFTDVAKFLPWIKENTYDY